MNPPTMAGWNLALRFGLEMAALAGIGTAAWRLTDGQARWAVVVIAPMLAAVAWGTFNVVDDPSRSGAAPIEVPGSLRLALELAVLGAGAAGFFVLGQRAVGVALAGLVAVHYFSSMSRVEWLVSA